MRVPRSGRPRKLTEADIVAAVLAEGFAGLTVPAVAKRLGVSTMTLYRYAPTRAELIALAWGHVLDAATWPQANGDWRRLLHEHACVLWDLLAEHPFAVIELHGAVVPPQMADLYDDLALALTRQGFSPHEAVFAVDLVLDLALDHRRSVEDLSRLVEGTGNSAGQELSTLWARQESDSLERRAVRDAMCEAIALPERDWFTAKLDLVLDGLSQRRDGRPSRY